MGDILAVEVRHHKQVQLSVVLIFHNGEGIDRY
jgi:hypothetical protein